MNAATAVRCSCFTPLKSCNQQYKRNKQPMSIQLHDPNGLGHARVGFSARGASHSFVRRDSTLSGGQVMGAWCLSSSCGKDQDSHQDRHQAPTPPQPSPLSLRTPSPLPQKPPCVRTASVTPTIHAEDYNGHRSIVGVTLAVALANIHRPGRIGYLIPPTLIIRSQIC